VRVGSLVRPGAGGDARQHTAHVPETGDLFD
jgi:hypothetical protein